MRDRGEADRSASVGSGVARTKQQCPSRKSVVRTGEIKALIETGETSDPALLAFFAA